MAEVLGASAAGVQLFETAILIFKRVNKAYIRQKELSSTLEKYERELLRIRGLHKVVKDEKALKEADLTDVLGRLRDGEAKLSNWLNKVDPGDKKSIRKFADQLVHGTKDRKKLNDIMVELDRVNDELNTIVQLHHIRVSYSISQAVVANKKVTTFRHRPSKRCSTPTSEKITVSTKTHSSPRSSRSNISSKDNEDDFSDSSASQCSGPSQPTFTKPQVPKTRIIKSNTTKPGSAMFNAPFGGKDLWSDVQVVEIENNIAEEGSTMVNYRMDDHSIVLANEQQERQQKMYREQLIWQRDNMFGGLRRQH